MGRDRREPERCEQWQRQTRKQIGLLPGRRERVSPQCEGRGPFQIGGDVGAVPRDVLARPDQLLICADLVVGRNDRRKHQQCECPRDAELCHAVGPMLRSTPQLERDDRDDRQREEVEVVAVREPLEQEYHDERGQGPSGTGAEEPMQCPESDRHPSVHQHLEVRHVRHTEGEERKGDRRHHRCEPVPGQRRGQQIHPGAGQDIRQEKRNVVCEHRVARQPLHRCGQDGDAKKML